MKGYIYCIKQNIDSKVLYIGCTSNFLKRKYEHFKAKSSTKIQPIQRYIRKMGKQNFKMEIILEKEFKDLKEMYKYEGYYIKKYNTFEKGFNYNYGGATIGGHSKNPNATKIKCVNNGEVFTCIKDACEKYNLAQSEMASHLSRKRYIDGIGKRKYGVPLFFEYIEPKNKERKISVITKQRIKEANRKRNCKKVIELNTNKIFNSLSEAALYYNISKGTLSDAIKHNRALTKYPFIKLEYLKV